MQPNTAPSGGLFPPAATDRRPVGTPEAPWWKNHRVRAAAVVVGALSFRYVCHSVMLLMALIAERRPAPSLPDAVLAAVPRVAWIDRYNYHIWLLCYVPIAVVFGFRRFKPFVRFLFVGGFLSLLRGGCILLTGLGPVHGPDVNAGLSWPALWEAWTHLINPMGTLTGYAAHLHLTKDLFFSGHTATTFLLALYCYRDRVLRPLAVGCHLVVVAVVFLAHLHYAIDVVGAYAITFGVYVLVEWRWGPGKWRDRTPSSAADPDGAAKDNASGGS
jgi:hypothetical protein